MSIIIVLSPLFVKFYHHIAACRICNGSDRLFSVFGDGVQPALLRGLVFGIAHITQKLIKDNTAANHIDPVVKLGNAAAVCQRFTQRIA